MSQYEGTLAEKIAFLTAEQQERVLRFVEAIESKEPSNTLRILIRFESYFIEVLALHPDRSDFRTGFRGAEEPIDILVSYLKDHHHVIAKASAEEAFYVIGSLIPLTPEHSYTVFGRNVDTGIPASTEITSIEVREQTFSTMQHKIQSLAGNINLIPQNMKLPEDVLADATIRIRGRYGRLPGLRESVQQATGLKVVD